MNKFNRVGLCTACSAVKRIGHANHNQGLARDGVCYDCRLKSNVYAVVAEASGLCVSHIKGSDQLGVELGMDSRDIANLERHLEELHLEELFSLRVSGLEATTTVDDVITWCTTI